MDNLIRELVLFAISFIVVFLLYEIFVVRRAKSKKKPKEPFEVTYLVGKYRLDLEKVNYKKLLRVISLVSSFDIALVVSIIVLLKIYNGITQLLQRQVHKWLISIFTNHRLSKNN